MKRSEIEDRIAKALSTAKKYIEESPLRTAGVFFLAGIVVALFLRFFVTLLVLALVVLVCVWLVAEKDSNLPTDQFHNTNGSDHPNA